MTPSSNFSIYLIAGKYYGFIISGFLLFIAGLFGSSCTCICNDGTDTYNFNVVINQFPKTESGSQCEPLPYPPVSVQSPGGIPLTDNALDLSKWYVELELHGICLNGNTFTTGILTQQDLVFSALDGGQGAEGLIICYDNFPVPNNRGDYDYYVRIVFRSPCDFQYPEACFCEDRSFFTVFKWEATFPMNIPDEWDLECYGDCYSECNAGIAWFFENYSLYTECRSTCDGP